MTKKLTLAAFGALLTLGAVAPQPALARHHTRYYHGHTEYRRCGGGNGAVGTVAGGVGGALIGNAVGGGVLGTIGGGVGGALLGRHLDKTHTRHRRGC